MISSSDTTTTIIGVLLLVVSLFCLGTWPALLLLSSSYSSSRQQQNPIINQDDEALQPPANNHDETQQQDTPPINSNKLAVVVPRNICHVYLDYASSYLISSIIVPLIFIMVFSDGGDDDNYNNDSAATSIIFQFPLPLFAILGGIFFSLGSLALLWATSVCRATLTFVVMIQASITGPITGLSSSFALEVPNKPAALLFAGVGFFLVAIMAAIRSQMRYRKQQQIHQRLNNDPYRYFNTTTAGLPSFTEIELPFNSCHRCSDTSSLSSPTFSTTEFDRSISSTSSAGDSDVNIGGGGGGKREQQLIILDTNKITPTLLLNQPIKQETGEDQPQHGASETHLQSTSSSPMFIALTVAIVGGLCCGFISPCLNIAMNDPFGWVTENNNSNNNNSNQYNAEYDYATNMWFSFAFLITSVICNSMLLRLQQQYQLGNNNDDVKSVYQLLKAYVIQDSLVDRHMALIAGFVCALGNNFIILLFRDKQLVDEVEEGYSSNSVAAGLVKAYPLVTTIWDIVLFGEFRNIVKWKSRLALMITTMYVLYFSGVIFTAASGIPGF